MQQVKQTKPGKKAGGSLPRRALSFAAAALIIGRANGDGLRPDG